MSIATLEHQSIRLSFERADEVHEGLERAVESLIAAAAESGTCGILVTRHEPGTYTVALDESVPFGQTHEAFA